MSRQVIAYRVSVWWLLLGISGSIFAQAALASEGDFAQARTERWEFTALLDDNKIGYHRFEVTHQGDQRWVKTEAQFDIKFLFFTAYTYRHRNSERWDGGCLRYIEAETDDNGEAFTVEGRVKPEERAFIVAANGDTQRIAATACPKSFAYWSPEFVSDIGTKRLLNPQTGQVVAVNITELGADTLVVKGQRVPALRYRLTGKELDIDLWYHRHSRQWLRLESNVKGRRLIYELSASTAV